MTSTSVFRAERLREVADIVRSIAPDATIIARGVGTAYGDAATNDHAFALDIRALNKLIAFDEERGTLACQGGVTLQAVLDTVLPRGWFISVSPGTSKSTVAGCFACDVHGKNHHTAGSFAEYVEEIHLLTGDGSVTICSPSRDPELFWATAGGMGMTGVILQLTLRLKRVETSFMRVRYRKLRDLDETFAALGEPATETYSVAWIDCLARGATLGRSVLGLGEHATLDQLDARQRSAPLARVRGRNLRVPFTPPSGLMSTTAMRIFNAAYYASRPSGSEPQIEPATGYFYPLDSVENWNTLYGRRGFVEYQFVAPMNAAHEVLRFILERLSRTGHASFLSVVKRMRRGNPGPLSFPAEGYTLAVDIPNGGPTLLPMLRQFDDRVAAAGGRVYLAKDSRLGPEHLDRMYPRRREWAAVVARADPTRRFGSTLERRLGLRDV